MTQVLVLQFCFSLVAAFLGAAAGWWLRGRPLRQGSASTAPDRKHVAQQAMQSLHAAAETVRSCVEQHIECMRTVQLELHESTATEPAIITSAAASIIAANGLVQHQFDDIHRALHSQKSEISNCLSSEKLLFTFASLDRQKHVYSQVLASLEMLAGELLQDVDGHGRRLNQITKGIETPGQQNLDNVNGAVTQILDATEDIQQRVESAEKRIVQQAETVQMQAILSHADLLTSLPNRRAFETELERAASPLKGRTPPCTIVFVDLDRFSQVNAEYGHHGGDVILRQSAGIIKEMLRGKDMIARYGGDTFVLLLNETTLHDSLPIAERIRKQLETTEFSHGSRPLHITASLGIAQLRPDEMLPPNFARAEEALGHAKHAGGNICYRHDGQACFPVSSVFQAKEAPLSPESMSLASMWRDSATAAVTGGVQESSNGDAAHSNPQKSEPMLSGRSLFAANLNRRLSEWKRGGTGVSVAVVQVDQLKALVEQFGPQGHSFLRQVMGRLLEAATRDMDERCEFEDGLFALILPATDEANAIAVAERLRSQVRQCKVRMGNDLWDLTASIGLAHCTVASRVMDIMLSAEAAMSNAAKLGGDAISIGQPVKEDEPSVKRAEADLLLTAATLLAREIKSIAWIVLDCLRRNRSRSYNASYVRAASSFHDVAWWRIGGYSSMKEESAKVDPLATREIPATALYDNEATRPYSVGDSATGSSRLSVRCPNCHSPTEVAVDTLLTDLTCSCCGSHFSLVDQSQATRMAPALSTMGRFELVERIGVGGFGSVWKARDKELDRTVAIKIPRQGAVTSEEQEKFFREARAAAQLRHPNIVSVHEVGRDGDSIYIVSDFVRGVTLGDWLTGQQPTSREAAALCAKIADALHHAHEQGIVHRDLKPANIMIDANGEPHLMDFGLARREVGEVTMTLDGQVLGTPAYMSPEQAQGEAHSADRRSDVYSLGVILFQLLTGELPFRGNASMLMHQVIHDEPPSPRKLNGTIPLDLETTTLKCLEKNAEKRYPTARELSNELGRYLRGEPILARPVTRIEQTWRWSRRHPVHVIAVTAAMLAVVTATTSLAFFRAKHAAVEAYQKASHERQIAEEQRHQAEQQLDLAVQAKQNAETSRAESEALKHEAMQQHEIVEELRKALEQERAAAKAALEKDEESISPD